jgi:hypothetical protein
VKLADFDQSGTPKHVQMIARAAEFALWRFRALGFDPPALGKDGTPGSVLKIVLAHTRGYRGMTSPDWDFIEISNQIKDEQALLTVGHEIFHRIQYAYNATRRELRVCEENEIDLWTLVLEGSARFAEDLLVDALNRYEYDGERWFTERRRPLFRTASYDGALSGAVYEASLFWKYVAEQHGPPMTEPNPEVRPREPWPPRGWSPEPEVRNEAKTQRTLLEATRDTPPVPTLSEGVTRKPITIKTLREARRRMGGLGRFDQPAGVGSGQTALASQARGGGGLVRWVSSALDIEPAALPRDAPLSGETTWGNFVIALILNGQSSADRRFRFLETPGFRGTASGRLEVPANQTVAYEILPEIGPGAVPTSGGGGGRPSGLQSEP